MNLSVMSRTRSQRKNTADKIAHSIDAVPARPSPPAGFGGKSGTPPIPHTATTHRTTTTGEPRPRAHTRDRSANRGLWSDMSRPVSRTTPRPETANQRPARMPRAWLSCSLFQHWYPGPCRHHSYRGGNPSCGLCPRTRSREMVSRWNLMNLRNLFSGCTTALISVPSRSCFSLNVHEAAIRRR